MTLHGFGQDDDYPLSPAELRRLCAGVLLRAIRDLIGNEEIHHKRDAVVWFLQEIRCDPQIGFQDCIDTIPLSYKQAQQLVGWARDVRAGKTPQTNSLEWYDRALACRKRMVVR